MLRALLLVIAALALAFGAAPAAAQDQGRFVETGSFAVAGLPEQRLTIWLPPGYAQGDRRYPVLYMHDGHNLFDPAKSNFNKVWAADKAVLQLVREGAIEPHIIVGIWAPGEDRYRQYLPRFASQAASGELAEKIAVYSRGHPVISARYLSWIAEELKPQIDRDYRTLADPAHTAIAGSSMGGLMSCYAIAERPDIFARAACVSSHWPIMLPEDVDASREQVLAIWRTYFAVQLGRPDGRRVWMDHGTATLDAYYAPYQQSVDATFRDSGWREGVDFRTEVYEGAEHEENAWAARLPEILGWLLAEG